MRNYWHDIPTTETSIEDNVYAIIEIPEGSSCKYEYDKEYGIIRMDRVLFTSTHYPSNYGFIPKTYADDKDPLDILVFCKEHMVPGILARARVIGVAIMVDGEDFDEKIIGVSADDPTFAKVNSIADLPPHLIDEMSHFFDVYKELEGKKTKVLKVKDRKAALEVIKKCQAEYKKYMAKKKK
jgi:inorganic pyrophosphatase